MDALAAQIIELEDHNPLAERIHSLDMRLEEVTFITSQAQYGTDNDSKILAQIPVSVGTRLTEEQLEALTHEIRDAGFAKERLAVFTNAVNSGIVFTCDELAKLGKDAFRFPRERVKAMTVAMYSLVDPARRRELVNRLVHDSDIRKEAFLALRITEE